MTIRILEDAIPIFRKNIHEAQALINSSPQGFCLVASEGNLCIGQIEGDKTGLWLVSPIAKGAYVADTIVGAEKIARHWNKNLTSEQAAAKLQVEIVKRLDMLRHYQKGQRDLIKVVKP